MILIMYFYMFPMFFYSCEYMVAFSAFQFLFFYVFCFIFSLSVVVLFLRWLRKLSSDISLSMSLCLNVYVLFVYDVPKFFCLLYVLIVYWAQILKLDLIVGYYYWRTSICMSPRSSLLLSNRQDQLRLTKIFLLQPIVIAWIKK